MTAERRKRVERDAQSSLEYLLELGPFQPGNLPIRRQLDIELRQRPFRSNRRMAIEVDAGSSRLGTGAKDAGEADGLGAVG